MASIQAQYFDYTVYSLNDCHTFIHFHLNNEDRFYEYIATFFLNENRLIQYVENDRAVHFTATQHQKIELYKRLALFAANPIEFEITEAFDPVVMEALKADYEIIERSDGGYIAKQPVVGRFGEYFLHVILSEFFKLNCVVPKISLTTDSNMSVYGIDSLFYSHDNHKLFFGESKFSKALNSGVSLIRKSLETYEDQIRDEFNLVLSERHIRRHPEFEELFSDKIAQSVSFDKFVEHAGLTTICVPLFIAHGNETDPDYILMRLSSIPKKQLFNMETEYWGISLPVISKDRLIQEMIRTIGQIHNRLIAESE